MPRAADRTLTVLAHLMQDPNGNHTAVGVSRATGLPYHHVQSAFGLLIERGWAIRRDSLGNERPITLTSIGRVEAAALVEVGQVEVPLAVLDREDPALADRARAQMGWEPKHTKPAGRRTRKAGPALRVV